MKRHSVIFVFLILTSLIKLHSQDTTYYNKSWEKAKKSDATYYRIVQKNNLEYFATDYFIDGKTQMTGVYSSLEKNIKNGPFKYYSSSGFITSEGNYLENKKEGLWVGYYENAIDIWYKENYKNDTLEGLQYYYYQNGSLKRKDSTIRGEIKMGHCYTSSGSDTAYFPFRKDPKFVGGEQARALFIQNNIKYPFNAEKKNIQGMVILSFIVEMDGSISEVKLVQGVHPLLNEEAIKVTKSMPPWIPAKIDGKATRAQFNMPILFKLRSSKQ